MQNLVFWDVTPFGVVEIHRSFGGTFFLELQDRKGRKRQKLPPKDPWILTRVGDVTRRMTVLFAVTCTVGSPITTGLRSRIFGCK